MQVQQRTDLGLRVRDIQQKIYREMEHRYLNDVLDHPELEILQLILADAMLQAADVPQQTADKVISSLMLIYHGLAVHGDIEALAAQPDERFRQLGVLAGAYFSSKYYRLLAVSGEIALIGQFAQAIQEINEVKAELVRESRDFGLRSDRYTDLQETIHGRLLHCLRVNYLPDQPYWEEIITLLVRASVLKKELQVDSAYLWTQSLANLRVWQQANSEERKWLKQMKVGDRADKRLLSLHVKYGTSSEIYDQVEECVGLSTHAMRMIPDLMEDLREICDGLLAFDPLVSRACEEG